MSGNFWICIGIISGAISLFSIPYGFHLKSKEKQSGKAPVAVSTNINGDVFHGDKVGRDKIVDEGNKGIPEQPQLDREAKIKITKLQINRELDDFEKDASDILEAFKKETNMLANGFSGRGTGRSGIHIRAQIDLSRETHKKIARRWEKMDRNIEDILIDKFGQTSFTEMINELLEEHNRRADLFSTLKEMYHLIEESPKSWEKAALGTSSLTKDFKLE